MKSFPFIIIAMDGGAASGKSSTAKALAEAFGLLHVDTGTHYRAITAYLLDQKVSADSEEAVEEALQGIELGTHVSGRSALLSINDRIPEDESLRSESVNAHVSLYSAFPSVRAFLLDYQRSQAEIARDGGFRGLIMEGRDITSVIFPNADFRFFLTADPATRAKRRALQGQTDAIQVRDKMDSSRKTAPLVCPEGAINIDTSTLSLESVIGKVSEIINLSSG